MTYSILKKILITVLYFLFLQTNFALAEVKNLSFQNTERLFWTNENEIKQGR